MRILKFIVNKQKIRPDPNCDFSGLVKGTSGFWRMDHEYPVLVQNGQCEIPPEALSWDYFSLSLMGMKDNGNYILTTDKILVSQKG